VQGIVASYHVALPLMRSRVADRLAEAFDQLYRVMISLHRTNFSPGS
jgi:hypothetical protein